MTLATTPRISGAGKAPAPNAGKPPELILTEPAYIILVALIPRPAHGYRIMQIVNDIFGTGFRIGPGTLYRTLQRLTAGGLIDEVEGQEDGEDERRRAYRLTEDGLAAVQAEVRRLDCLVRLAKAQLAPLATP
jgi:DNA-binding PadR family transcriptional regulator